MCYFPFRSGSRRDLQSLAAVIVLFLIAGFQAVYGQCITNTPNPGCVHFQLRTSSADDQYTNSPSQTMEQWFQTHLWEMQVYSPYFDSRLSWYPRAVTYFESYGIHLDDPLVSEHPEWILKDPYGNWLYLNWGCTGSSCPQYAFDFANPAFIQYQIAALQTMMNAGYIGVWLDDVDLNMETSNGAGTTVAPIDSTTGQVMTQTAWEQHMADYVTAIRQAFPNTQMIHNAIWYAGSQPAGSDPYVQQEIQAADYINLERGVSDPGVTAGTGEYSLYSMLNYIDVVHSLGKKVVIEELNFNGDYGLAGYFLISSGIDALGNTAVTPDNWWSGYDVDLGTPLGARYSWNNVFRRDYTGGIVVLNPNGASTVSLTLPGTYTTTSGTQVTEVTLSGGQAAVLMAPVATTSEPAPTCSFSLAPASAISPSSGGSGSFSVGVSSGCSWTASTTYSWLHVVSVNSTSGTDASAGTGAGTVAYSVDPNTSTSQQSGTFTVGNQSFSITQSAAVATPTPSSPDLALNQPATQSSTYDPGFTDASNAVDGNTDGAYADGSVSHTELDQNAWWQVDLGAPAAINTIVIWNRTDCCGARLSDYWVFVSDTPFLDTDTPTTLQNRAGTWSSHQTVEPNPSSILTVPAAQGRYVRVQLSGANYLSLAEVQVYGTFVTATGVDLALNQNASQSSTYDPGFTDASNAVDGNTDGVYADGSVSHTEMDQNAWWEVDLGAPASIGSIVIWNRTDCCGARLSDYWVFVSDIPFLDTDTPTTLQNRAGTWAIHQTVEPNPSSSISVPAAPGRYVRVQLSGTNYLSLAEVQVYGQ
jgi:hypothetical protein